MLTGFLHGKRSEVKVPFYKTEAGAVSSGTTRYFINGIPGSCEPPPWENICGNLPAPKFTGGANTSEDSFWYLCQDPCFGIGFTLFLAAHYLLHSLRKMAH